MAITKDSHESFARCANLIKQADGLLASAGAGHVTTDRQIAFPQ